MRPRRLLRLHKKEKDSKLGERIWLNVLVELDGMSATRVTLIENFASNAAVQKLVDVKPDRTSPEIP